MSRQEKLDEITIDKGIPVPASFQNKSTIDTEDLLKRMEVGDSVFFHGVTTNVILGRLRPTVKKLGIRITSRTVNGGVRVWRIDK